MTQLTILITDTNIWIDLRNGGILEEVIKLPYEFMIPDVAQNELTKQVTWAQLMNLGIKEGNLNGKQVLDLAQIQATFTSLSTIDIAAFILARDQKSVLLTGEEKLRKLALLNNVQVHGLLWLMDEMVQYRVLTKKQAYFALKSITSQNPRLPKEECQKRLILWFDEIA